VARIEAKDVQVVTQEEALRRGLEFLEKIGQGANWFTTGKVRREITEKTVEEGLLETLKQAAADRGASFLVLDPVLNKIWTETEGKKERWGRLYRERRTN